MQKTRPFLANDQSDSGSALVASTGYVVIPDNDKLLMLSRAGADGGVDLSSIVCGPDGAISVAGSSTVFPVANLWAEV